MKFEWLLIMILIASCSSGQNALSRIPASRDSCVDLVNSIVRTNIQNDALEFNHFNVERDFDIYNSFFRFYETGSFDQTVVNLPSGTTWFDMGTGLGRVFDKGLNLKNPRIHGVGISYQRPDHYEEIKGIQNRFKYLHGDYVENMARDGKLKEWKGKSMLVTDLYGPLSYSEEIPLLLQIYLDLLAKDGTLMFNMMVEKNYSEGMNLITPTQSNIINGNKFGIVDWLKTIPGISVVEKAVIKKIGDIYFEEYISIKVVKQVEVVKVPNNLRLLKYEEGSPPNRQFNFD